MGKPPKLVIDRERWLRGEEDGYLIREHDHKMCCLGFLGLACGIDHEAMTGVGDPSASQGDWPAEVIWVGGGPSSWASRAIHINDELNEQSLPYPREAALTELFAEIGIELEFVDHAPTT